MARLAIQSQAAPAAQGPIETQIQDLVAVLLIACVGSSLADPGILFGAMVTAGWIWLYRPSMVERTFCALLIAAPLLALHSFIVVGWPWREWLSTVLPFQVRPVNGLVSSRSLYAEALLGPLWLETVMLAVQFRGRRVDAQIRRDHRLDRQRWDAISGGSRRFKLPDPHARRSDESLEHPKGTIRLGMDAETSRPFDLQVPGDLAAHIFMPGASGTGKTNTLLRLIDGALVNGYCTVIVDCKAGGLGRDVRQIAARRGVPFHVVDPAAPDTLGYNICTGDGPTVSNKILGAFEYGPGAEIYKHIAMEAVPLAVRGLLAAKQPVTLDSLYGAFGYRGFAQLADKIADDDHLRDRLLDLGEHADRTTKSGYAGLQHRLGAVMEGRYGRLFRLAQPLDWDRLLDRQCVIYIALSALGGSEDQELMGRVIGQDLKQVADRRLTRIAHGERLIPLFIPADEYAALGEAEQWAGLLLMAREANVCSAIITQVVPITEMLRKACLGAGLLISHRVETEDAELIAAQFGTRQATDITHQIDYATGFSEKGSIKRVDKFNVHPNELRTLKRGLTTILLTDQQLHAIARVPRLSNDGEWTIH